MTVTDGPRIDGSSSGNDALVHELAELAQRHGVDAEDPVQAVLGLVTRLADPPNTVFEQAPDYVREIDAEPAVPLSDSPLRSTHGFFDVIRARASRRDFGRAPLDLARLGALLEWTMGRRGEVIAYDYRDAPQRYVPSSGGLAGVEAYVIAGNVACLDPGAYYFDYRRGLVPVSRGYMIQKVADLNPSQSWVARAAALVVMVCNTDRVAHKYGAMGAKLLLLDAGVAAGHAELVATALELRSTLLGGLDAARMARLLRLDGNRQVPALTLAVGTRERI